MLRGGEDALPAFFFSGENGIAQTLFRRTGSRICASQGMLRREVRSHPQVPVLGIWRSFYGDALLRECVPAVSRLLHSPSTHLGATSPNDVWSIQGRSRFQPRLTDVEDRSLSRDLQHAVLDPLELVRRPDPRSSFAFDHCQRDRTVVPRVPRPGVIVARHPAVTLRDLRGFRYV